MSDKSDALELTESARGRWMGGHADARNSGNVEGMGRAATIARELGQDGVSAAITAEMRRMFPKLAEAEIALRKL